MGFFAELFGRNKVTSRDLKTALLRVERERRKKRHEIKKLEARQERTLDQLKEARKTGNGIEVDYLWEDLKGVKLERSMLMREATVLNLEGITVKRYLRGLERLERQKDQTSIDKLLGRVRSSGLEAKLDAERVKADEYLDELRAVLDEAGLEAELFDVGDEDPEKAEFLRAIDGINQAEESGDLETALEREDELRARLDEEDPTT